MSKQDAGGRRDWKRGGSRPPSAEKRSWQQAPGAPRTSGVAARNWMRRLKILVGAAVAIGLAVILAINLIPKQVTPLITLAVTAYDMPFPPNAWAQEDAERLAGLGKNVAGTADNLLTYAAAAPATKRELLEQLGEHLAKGVGKKVSVVYLSAHGLVRPDGEPCLAVGTGPAEDWLPVKELIESLSKAPGGVKLLLLDSSRQASNWSLGVLYNGFDASLARVMDELHRAGQDNVVVLNSTSPGQVGWPLPPHAAGTPFGYFAARGLSGLDGVAGSDRWVTVAELAAYVRSQVSGWVRANRYDDQDPWLLPANTPHRELTVVYASGGEPKAPDAGPGPSDETERLLWEAHEKLDPNGPETAQPGRLGSEHLVAWQSFQTRLLHWEQLAQAGRAYADHAARLGEELKVELDALQQAAADTAELPASNLALAAVWNQARPTPAEQTQFNTAWADPTDKLRPAIEKLPYPVRAAAAWNLLLKQARQDAVGIDLERLTGLVGRPATSDDPGFAEWHLVHLLLGPSLSQVPASLRDDRGTWLADTLELFQASQLAAAPRDARLHYFLRPTIFKGDAQRRMLEDSLLLGAPPVERTTQIAAARAPYEQAASLAALVGRAYQVRDRALCELPWMAQWVARRPSNYDSAAMLTVIETRAQAVGRLQGVAENAQQLADDLEDALAASLKLFDTGEWARDLESLVKATEDGLLALQKEFFEAVAEVDQAANDEQQLRLLADILAGPLVTGEARLGLIQKMRSRESRLTPQQTIVATADDEPGDDPFLKVAVSWPVHPAEALLPRLGVLAPAAATEQGDPQLAQAELERKGALVRTRYLAAWQEAEQQIQASAGRKEPLTLGPARAELSQADLKLRMVAGLVVRDPEVPLTAAVAALARLALFDRGHLLLWQAKRTQEDFWGNGLEDDPAPYYAQVLKRTLDATRRPLQRASTARAELEQAYEARPQPADSVVMASLEKDKVTLLGDDPSARGFEHPVLVAPAERLPPGGKAGLAAVTTSGESVPLRLVDAAESLERLPLVVPTEQARTLQVRFDPPSGTDGGGSMWNLITQFRGHVFQKPFQVIRQGRGLELTVKHEPQPSFEVTVSGESDNPGSVLFVLDCSLSMGYPNTAPKTKTNPRGLSNGRMNDARNALITILEELSKEGGYRVGLWLYGHRRGAGATGYPAWNPAWGDEDPAVILQVDAKGVIPMQALHAASLVAFTDLLNDANKVQPMGSTPLYYSTIEAITTDLLNEPANQPRQIVVITDGESQNDGKSLDDLKEVFRNRRDIELIMIGCGTADDTGNLGAKIVEAPIKGRFEWAKNRELLKATLTNALITRFAVDELSANGVPKLIAQRKLKQALPVELTADTGQTFKVSLVNTSIQRTIYAEGGEAFRLWVEKQDGTPRLVHRRYGRNSGAPDDPDDDSNHETDLLNPLADPADKLKSPEKLYVAWHRPRKSVGGVRFPISFQNADEAAFSPRPGETWVEIRPQAGDGEANPYYFYDLPYEPQLPVPVVECFAPQWPAGAGTATIEAFCKLGRTEPTRKSRVAEVRSTDFEPHLRLRITGSDGILVDFNVRDEEGSGRTGAILKVTEQHSDQQVATFPVKVAVSGLPAAHTITHEYWHDTGRVVHTFHYPSGTSREDLLGHVVEITTRDALREDAVKVPVMTATGFQ